MAKYKEQDKDLIFALDIGTRSIVGVVGKPENGKFKVWAMDSTEHNERTMLDGQIDNIAGVAALAKTVTQKLTGKVGVRLKHVCVAAAGRALRTQRGSFSLELNENDAITANEISEIEAGAVSMAEEALQEEQVGHRQFYLVGYTVVQYRLDNYPLTTLLSHSGRKAECDIMATFLPGEVVESLYAAMREVGLQVSSLTLEPIAAMNAAIPADLRLLNLAMVDIGAGTSDIAICKDGSVIGYTMVTQAGDEITETIMQSCLVDFQMAEQMKRCLKTDSTVSYTNILGQEESIPAQELLKILDKPMTSLASAIAEQILELNGGAPSALFMAGGGSKLEGLQEKMAECLGMDAKRVALAGGNFSKSVFTDDDALELNNSEYTTPLGIAVSAGMGLLNDSYIVYLNGQRAKLFRNGTLTLREILMMNGYTYADLMGKTGASLSITVDDKHMLFRGEPTVPAILKLNGAEAPITAIVHAGDQIEFVPAKPGASATKTLADILGDTYTGSIYVNNREVSSLKTALRSGDVILTKGKPQPVITAEPTASAASDTEKAAETPLTPPKAVEPVSAAPQPTAEPARPVQKTMRVFLNDNPVLLPLKEGGEPYYLMDMLEYSGIDFQNLDHPLALEVNGAPCSFQTVLHPQDYVVIQPENTSPHAGRDKA